jgi:hypothetical protein
LRIGRNIIDITTVGIFNIQVAESSFASSSRLFETNTMNRPSGESAGSSSSKFPAVICLGSPTRVHNQFINGTDVARNWDEGRVLQAKVKDFHSLAVIIAAKLNLHSQRLPFEGGVISS